ncbi:hypothetical protein GJ744_009396 [Endocarpon pusillum]|uniref:3-oxo-5-alpha-steroid 4-dehydrogenase C-terminal domain-containing protein n=1 Tax=Endocarpon pusillum TaxID=364733 RepID=A0A8H7AJN3_9EURO|nr:hypothetical protein GJ744_009396 [Endocarpon pusillum]
MADYLPPTPQAYNLLFRGFKALLPLSLLLWIPQIASLQAMGRTSSSKARLNLPGRYAWTIAESVGPLNMLFIIYTLPSRLQPPAASPASLLGTGMPFFYHELLALLYLLHYVNRAIITPLFLAPSMSPIAAPVSILMALFQYANSSCLSCWLVYNAHFQLSHSNSAPHTSSSLLSPLFTNPLPLLGVVLFALGLYSNISSETTLFALRRAAALRRAKSEGKPLHNLSYDKVYVIPEPKGWFKYVLYPHYTMEWMEWTGYWLTGALAGLGWWGTPAMWFVVNEVATMAPRAAHGWRWYEGKFGNRALARRAAVLPGLL